MKAIELAALLRPFKAIENRNALSPTYRALELSPTKIIGRAAYAYIEVSAKLPIEETVFIDAATLLGVVNSLPPEGDIELSITDSTLEWECASSSGRLARAVITDAPQYQYRSSTKAWTPNAEFKQALRLGGLSCGAQSQESFGLYGVLIDNRDDLVICSSDDTTISLAALGYQLANCPEMLTLRPESADLLVSLIDIDDKGKGLGRMEFSEQYIHYYDQKVRCRVSMTNKPIEQDLKSVYGKYLKGKIVAPVPAARVKAFTQRAAAMAESKQHTYVALGASKGGTNGGRLTIAFLEGMAASDEYYLVLDLRLKEDLPDINVDSIRLARGLEHIQDVVLDYLDRKIVVFRNQDKGFTYLVSGKQEAE